jgi:hypothetical protein
LTDVSEVLTASIISAIIALMIEKASTSEMSVNFYDNTAQQLKRQSSSYSPP